jgi:hypothetical protein
LESGDHQHLAQHCKRQQQQKPLQQRKQQQTEQQQQRPKSPRSKLRLALNAARFIARARLAARAWARHDRVRQRLAECLEGMEREARIRRMRDQWRAEVAG